MADYLTTDTELTSIANAIRTKGGTSTSLVYPTGFVSAINDISTGGVTVTDTTDSHGGIIRTIDTDNVTTIEPLSVTQNGTYTATSGKAYSPVTVNVSGGGGTIKHAVFEWDSSLLCFCFSSGDRLSASDIENSYISAASGGCLIQKTYQDNYYINYATMEPVLGSTEYTYDTSGDNDLLYLNDHNSLDGYLVDGDQLHIFVLPST